MANGNGEIKLRIHEEVISAVTENYHKRRRSLYIAATRGNWKDAEDDLEKNPGVCITEGKETSLHISALAGKLEFVQKLVPYMNNQDLEKQNKAGNTALCLAATTGNVEIAKVMINKHPQLARISGDGGTQPVMMAATFGHGSMVEYIRLQLQTGDWTDEEDTQLLTECISSNLFDVARKLIERKPTLAVTETAWDVLTKKPMADRSKKRKWNTCLLIEEAHDENSLKFKSYDLLKYMLETATQDDQGILKIVKKAPEYLFDAAKQGNFELFKLLLEEFPEHVWVPDERKLSLFHVAVEYRHESIFALLREMDEVKRLVTTYSDEETGDNMLHLAAKLAPRDKLNSVSGAAFQMQQEILWYKAVEKIVPPSYRNMPNTNGDTPSDIFDEEHKLLLKEGEKWMKATAKSYMLVAALVATVIFAAAFTPPSGENTVVLKFYFVSEVFGLLSSSTSILLDLSILTARVDKYAFQHSLPTKLMIGLATLFFSIAFMVIAFSATIFLNSSPGILALLLLFAFVPLVFISLKYRLLVDIVLSTFVSRIQSFFQIFFPSNLFSKSISSCFNTKIQRFYIVT